MRLGRALPWLAIPAVVVPFCLWLIPSWWDRLDSYGWFKWVMAAWALGTTAAAIWYVVAPAIERAYHVRRGERIIRRLETSERETSRRRTPA